MYNLLAQFKHQKHHLFVVVCAWENYQPPFSCGKFGFFNLQFVLCLVHLTRVAIAKMFDCLSTFGQLILNQLLTFWFLQMTYKHLQIYSKNLQ